MQRFPNHGDDPPVLDQIKEVVPEGLASGGIRHAESWIICFPTDPITEFDLGLKGNLVFAKFQPRSFDG